MQTIALILYYLVAKDHSRCSRIFFCHSSTIESAIPRNSNILSQLFHENQADNAGKPLNLYGGSYPVLKNKKLLCIRCFSGHFPRNAICALLLSLEISGLKASADAIAGQ